MCFSYISRRIKAAEKIIIPVVRIARASRGAPDIPNSENIDRDAVAGLVKSVAEGWCCHLAEKNTLALFIPSKLFSSTLSRENFVDLLEYCEEHLKVRRILACFNKSDINPCQGIPRALRCIGFTLLPPERYPAGIDKNTIFAMVYKI
ncbi:hypothetical protein niasHT_019880 [Heterodera trifolii]|uniref:Ornithine decarboxylase antizyme n=1 Tax=Heterodera trifolii TaxID=157864 RepID=A0ABD2KY77_9BILA